MTLGLVCVYVAVDIPLDGPNTNYFVFPDYRTDELYEELDTGVLPAGNVPFAYVALASRKDPDNPELCPPGHTNFQIMTLAPRGNEFWGVDAGPADGGKYRRNETYLARKQELTDRLLDAAEAVGRPNHIVHCEMATTLSHERYIHSTGGTSYGFRHSPDQTGDNRPDHRTEIEGLWVVGADGVRPRDCRRRDGRRVLRPQDPRPPVDRRDVHGPAAGRPGGHPARPRAVRPAGAQPRRPLAGRPRRACGIAARTACRGNGLSKGRGRPTGQPYTSSLSSWSSPSPLRRRRIGGTIRLA